MSIVTAVLSISAANGWFIENAGATKLEDLEPVACFALVTVIDPAFTNLGSETVVVPLTASRLGQSLVGLSVAELGSAIHEHVLRTVWSWLYE